MSRNVGGLIKRAVERLLDGPACPNCTHLVGIHDADDRCLGADYNKVGTEAYWCDCTSMLKEKQ